MQYREGKLCTFKFQITNTLLQQIRGALNQLYGICKTASFSNVHKIWKLLYSIVPNIRSKWIPPAINLFVYYFSGTETPPKFTDVVNSWEIYSTNISFIITLFANLNGCINRRTRMDDQIVMRPTKEEFKTPKLKSFIQFILLVSREPYSRPVYFLNLCLTYKLNRH